MANEEIKVDSPAIGAELAGGRSALTEGGRPPAGNADARRIAELEREVWELRRTNEFLKEYFAKDLDADPLPPPAPPRVVGPIGERSHPEVVAAAPAGPPGAVRWTPGQSPQIQDTPQPMAVFRALGPIEAVVGGRLVDPGAPKQRALLALLVSKVGQPVAVDMIVEELWTGNPPPSAITSLQAYVANLRRVLEPDRAPRTPATVLRTYGRGYLLDSRVVEVDVHRFSERATAGWQALDWGEPQQAVREFEAGLALWRGQAYAEVADTTYVRPDVARLEELRLSVVEGRCAALLAVGAHEMAVAELEAFTRAHPLREYGCELLSLALYRAGRQADALGVLRTNQKRLAEELGIDPRPALQHLENEILNHAPALDWRPHPRVIAKSA
jgi:DNA-binding SARP family transcriptional activator